MPAARNTRIAPASLAALVLVAVAAGAARAQTEVVTVQGNLPRFNYRDAQGALLWATPANSVLWKLDGPFNAGVLVVTAAAPSGSINVNEGGVSILGGGFPTAKLQVGFVAEDVPDLVANNDRESLSPMDVVAVLTKVVQEQDRQLALQAEQLRAQSEELARQRAAIEKITASLGDANAAAPREARRATADRSS